MVSIVIRVDTEVTKCTVSVLLTGKSMLILGPKLSQEGLKSTIAIFHILFNRKMSGEVATFLDLENGK